ncbi:MAG: DUF2804 domain-containing protein [Bacilli bacterium]|nr:DUF2804 domain-containing protein [Bacilli bacterium]
MEHKLSEGLLLDEKGNLNEAGYAFGLVKEYRRDDIKAAKSRIKEWDYYFISDDEYGIALTIDDNSYMGMASISVLDFKAKKENTKSYIVWFTNGKVGLPSSSKNGDAKIKNKNFDMLFENKDGKRHIICSMKNVAKGKDFNCDFLLEKTLDKSMVIATPFKKKKHFYYNQKINLLKASGYFDFGGLHYEMKSTALGVLDWGRGVWTYKNTWYWSSLNAVYQGHNIGFNLGYGFGDTSAASENMFFYDKEAYKLEDVAFNIPKNDKGQLDFMSKWTFTSQKGDINLTFIPIIDRYANTNALIIQSKQHQVFGYFSGSIFAEGKEYKLENLLGFAEMVTNRW